MVSHTTTTTCSASRRSWRGARQDVKCHKCGELGHVKAQCKASTSTTQGSIDDAKTQTTKTKLAHEDSVEVLMEQASRDEERQGSCARDGHGSGNGI